MEFNPSQDAFCTYYTQNETLFGNATLSYAEAYDYKLDTLSDERPVLERNDKGEPIKYGKSEYELAYNTCSVEGARLLRTPKIQQKITKLLNDMLTDDMVDSQLSRVIFQNKDLTAKMAAIREFNKLKQRIVDKIDHTTKGEKIENSDEIKFLAHQLNELNRNRTAGITSNGSDTNSLDNKAQD